MPATSRPIPVIAGPTAVGKTALGIELAERLGGEIISADSRQIYRELTIGTAKPTADELARVRHHFIDERSLDEPYSAGQFAREATERITDLLNQGISPVVVGGSTLYLHALVHGLSPTVPSDPEVRHKLKDRLNSEGPAALFAELQRVDPVAAATMDASKTARVVSRPRSQRGVRHATF